jgi:hypothetical protein
VDDDDREGGPPSMPDYTFVAVSPVSSVSSLR